MNKRFVITIGISGSGKSTWAESFIKQQMQVDKHYVILERDQIRKLIWKNKTGIYPTHIEWQKWSWGFEPEVTHLQQLFLLHFYHQNYIDGIILSDTHVNVKTRKAVVSSILDLGVPIDHIRFEMVHCDLDEAIRRDALRKFPVSEKVIRDQYSKLMESDNKDIQSLVVK